MFLTNLLHSDKGIKHDSKLTGQTHKVKKKGHKLQGNNVKTDKADESLIIAKVYLTWPALLLT